MKITHSITEKLPNVIGVYQWHFKSSIQLIYMKYRPTLKGSALVGIWNVKYKNQKL